MTYNIVYVITYIFNAASIENYMSAIFGKAITSRLVRLLTYALYPLILCSVFFAVNIPVLNLICNIAALFIITCNYKAGIGKRILYSLFLYMFMFAVEAATVFATGYFGISAIEQGTYSQTIGLIVIALILYMLSMLFRKYKASRYGDKISLVEWVTIFLVPIASVYIIVIIGMDAMNRTYGVAAVVAVFLINIIVFRLYEKMQCAYSDRLSSIIFAQEREYYYNQCKYMQSSAEELRGFRHDMKNHLLVIGDLISGESLTKAADYINALAGKITNSTIYSHTGNVAIDSVLNFKLNQAQQRGIQLCCDVSVPSNLLLEASDITTILGNLLDNAINASEKIALEKRKISLDISYDKGRLFIEMSNAFDGRISLMEGKMVSDNPDKLNHGYGLKNIEKVLEKYDGFAKHDCDECEFRSSIMLYIKAVAV